MHGSENDFSVGRVLIQREGRNGTDGVTDGKVSNVFARGVDDTGSLITQTGRKSYAFDIFVVAPHRLGAVDPDRLDPNANVTRSGHGNLRFDEFEDVRSSGFRKLDGTRHGNLRGGMMSSADGFGGLGGNRRAVARPPHRRLSPAACRSSRRQTDAATLSAHSPGRSP